MEPIQKAPRLNRKRPRASGQEAVSNSVEPNANVTHSVFARLRGGSGASPVTGRVGGDFGRRPSAGASARYCTGYLGDIGVPVDPNPMDFSGWAEVFLDGRWYTIDARYNHPRIGRIVMAAVVTPRTSQYRLPSGSPTLRALRW
jgi:hypothetical protein